MRRGVQMSRSPSSRVNSCLSVNRQLGRSTWHLKKEARWCSLGGYTSSYFMLRNRHEMVRYSWENAVLLVRKDCRQCVQREAARKRVLVCSLQQKWMRLYLEKAILKCVLQSGRTMGRALGRKVCEMGEVGSSVSGGFQKGACGCWLWVEAKGVLAGASIVCVNYYDGVIVIF